MNTYVFRLGILFLGAFSPILAGKKQMPLFLVIQEEKKEALCQEIVELYNILGKYMECTRSVQEIDQSITESSQSIMEETGIPEKTLIEVANAVVEYMQRHIESGEGLHLSSVISSMKAAFPEQDLQILEPFIKVCLENFIKIADIAATNTEVEQLYLHQVQKIEQIKKELIATGMSHEEVKSLEESISVRIMEDIKKQVDLLEAQDSVQPSSE